MIDKVKQQIEVCRCNWKTLFVGSFVMHFFFDWIVLGIGVLIGMHIGHPHG